MVKLKSEQELLDLFRRKNFFRDDDYRQQAARILADATGIVTAKEDRYRYFYFTKDGDEGNYSIPFSAIRPEVPRLEQPQEPSIPVSVVKKMMMEIWQMAYGFDEHKFGIVDGEDIRSIAKEHLSKYGVTF